MTLQETVSTLLKKQVSEAEAMQFASHQFGMLAAFLQDKVLEEKFPNGFTDWTETHHFVVQEITVAENLEEVPDKVSGIRSEFGVAGLWEWSRDLTDKFEKENAGVVWGEEKDYHETFEAFIQKELYVENN